LRFLVYLIKMEDKYKIPVITENSVLIGSSNFVENPSIRNFSSDCTVLAVDEQGELCRKLNVTGKKFQDIFKEKKNVKEIVKDYALKTVIFAGGAFLFYKIYGPILRKLF
jgi:hypothetical protein